MCVRVCICMYVYVLVSMWDSFHGASLDAISIGGEATFREGIGPLLPGTEHGEKEERDIYIHTRIQNRDISYVCVCVHLYSYMHMYVCTWRCVQFLHVMNTIVCLVAERGALLRYVEVFI